MRKFLLKLFIFLLPVASVAVVLDRLLSNNLKNDNSFAEGECSVWNDIYGGKVNSAIVIYGSSRAWVHIDPNVITHDLHASSYNIGIDGHNFWLEYLRHRLLLKYNKKPRLIILSLDMFTLTKRPDLFNPDQFLPYMLYDRAIKDATITYQGYKLFDYEIPLLRYYGKKEVVLQAVKNMIHPVKNLPGRVKGFEGMDRPWSTNDVPVRVIVDPSTLTLFKHFIHQCREQQIRLLFVYTPEYINGRAAVANREQIMRLYKVISKKYQVPFYDYSDDPLSFQQKYFYNVEHLNTTGAELFSEQLAARLKADKF